MTLDKEPNEAKKQITSILEKVVIACLTLWLTFIQNYISTLEQRLFDMQRDRFTSQDAKELKDDLRKQLDAAISNMNNKIESTAASTNNKLDAMYIYLRSKSE